MTWWLLPIFTHASMGEKPDYTGLGSIKTHHFPQVEAVHTRVLRNLILKKKSFHRDGKIKSAVFHLENTVFPKSYYTTGQSDPLNVT